MASQFVKPPYLNDDQWTVMRALNWLGVGSLSQLKTTERVIDSLVEQGLAEPRRPVSPKVPLWQPSRRGDQLFDPRYAKMVS